MSATAVKHVWLWHYSSLGVAWPSYGMDVGINHSAEHEMGAAASEDKVQRKHSSRVFSGLQGYAAERWRGTVASRHNGGRRSHSLPRLNGHHSLMAGRQWAACAPSHAACTCTCRPSLQPHCCGLTATTVLWRGEFSSWRGGRKPAAVMAPGMSRDRYSSSHGSCRWMEEGASEQA